MTRAKAALLEEARHEEAAVPCRKEAAVRARLDAGLVALGHWESFPKRRRTWCAAPPGLGLDAWTRLLDAAMRHGGVAVLVFTGTLLPRHLHTPVLHLIAERLPRSSVVALNVGEFDYADDAAYDALETAVAASVLGHLYFKDPVAHAEHQLKQRVRAQLRRNCTKPDYLAQLARDEVWELGGANCWHNFSPVLRERALAWAAAPAGTRASAGGGVAVIPRIHPPSKARVARFGVDVEERTSKLEGAGKGLFARVKLPKGTAIPYGSSAFIYASSSDAMLHGAPVSHLRMVPGSGHCIDGAPSAGRQPGGAELCNEPLDSRTPRKLELTSKRKLLAHCGELTQVVEADEEIYASYGGQGRGFLISVGLLDTAGNVCAGYDGHWLYQRFARHELPRGFVRTRMNELFPHIRERAVFYFLRQ